jgi:hypothetical protein
LKHATFIILKWIVGWAFLALGAVSLLAAVLFGVGFGSRQGWFIKPSS